MVGQAVGPLGELGVRALLVAADQGESVGHPGQIASQRSAKLYEAGVGASPIADSVSGDEKPGTVDHDRSSVERTEPPSSKSTTWR